MLWYVSRITRPTFFAILELAVDARVPAEDRLVRSAYGSAAGGTASGRMP